jgi:anti-sigma factor RsiW
MTNLEQQCRSVRELASLELDGELSQLDAARLESHVAGCAACRSLRAELHGLTTALRGAPLEPLGRPIALPQRVHIYLRPLRVGAAAAAIALVAGLAGVYGTLRSSGPSQRIPSVEAGEGLDALRAVRRPRLLHTAHRTVPQAVPVGRAGGRPAV